jgi:hypothetical protein
MINHMDASRGLLKSTMIHIYRGQIYKYAVPSSSVVPPIRLDPGNAQSRDGWYMQMKER